MILKLGVKHQGQELYKVYINHDPEMTLTYFMSIIKFVHSEMISSRGKHGIYHIC